MGGFNPRPPESILSNRQITDCKGDLCGCSVSGQTDSGSAEDPRLTQAELAQMVDLSTKYISNVECGFKTPKLNTFVAIANALQCDANQLLSDVLDVTTSQESGLVSRKLQALPVDEQRRLLRVLEVMIDER